MCIQHTEKKELILGGSGQESFPTKGTRVVTLRLQRFPGGQVGQAKKNKRKPFFLCKEKVDQKERLTVCRHQMLPTFSHFSKSTSL